MSLLGFAFPAQAERTCRIVFPERPNDAPKFAYLFDGKESQRVTLPNMSFSEVVELPAGDIVVKMLPSEAKMPEDLPHGAPELKVPENIDDFYILVSEDKSNKCLPLALKLIDAGEGKLKPGETLWINLTEHRIEADLEGARMTIAPEGQTVSKAPLPDSGYYRAEFSYQLNGEGELQRMTEQSWWHDAKSRHLGFIQDTGGKHPKVYFYRDFR